VLRPVPGKTAMLYEVVAAETFEDGHAFRRATALAAHRVP
jgi:hypothetical protein